LRCKPGDANERGAVSDDRPRLGGEIGRVDSAADDPDPVPMRRAHPTHQLASPIAADAGDERGRLDLTAERKPDRRVEFVRSVGGEAEGRTAELACDQRYCGGIGTEMGMDVPDPQLLQTACEPCRLEKIGDVPQLLVETRSAQPKGFGQAREGSAGTSQTLTRGGQEQTAHSTPQDDLGLSGFPDVGFIPEFGAWRADREAVDGMAEPLDALDLSPDERMADSRIDIAQIGEAHAHSRFGLVPRAPIAKARRAVERSVLDVTGREGLGDQMRLVARVELVAEVLDVALDRSRRDSELQRTLLR
jgi:hypothetical protein